MTQFIHKKQVIIDVRAKKELEHFSQAVQMKFYAAFDLLEEWGYLNEPHAKKLTEDLFEIRIKHLGQWRSVYSYIKNNWIIILTVFQKKTQKTPSGEIKRAKKRLQNYEI
jgi:phage-related protein